MTFFWRSKRKTRLRQAYALAAQAKIILFTINPSLHCWVGTPDQPNWTVQHFRRKHQFMNPIHQNAKHCRAVAALLGLPQSQVRSVVAFSRRARFKTLLPDNVMYIDQVPRYISLTGSLEQPLTDAEIALYKTRLDHYASQAKQLRKVHLAQFETSI